MKQKSRLRPVLLWLLVASLPVLLFLLVFSGRREFQYGLASHSLAPNGARDINVFKLHDMATQLTAVDYAVEEAAFVIYAASQDWSLNEIEFPCEIMTARWFAGESKEKRVVQHGLSGGSKPKPNGGGYRVAYDRDEGRAYISYAAR